MKKKPYKELYRVKFKSTPSQSYILTCVSRGNPSIEFDSNCKCYVQKLTNGKGLNIEKLSETGAIIIQLCPMGKKLSVRVGMIGTSGQKRRFFFSSSFSKLSITSLHAQVPISLSKMKINQWYNVIINANHLFSMYWKKDSLARIVGITLGPYCKVRHIGVYPDGILMDEEMPKELKFPLGVDCQEFSLGSENGERFWEEGDSRLLKSSQKEKDEVIFDRNEPRPKTAVIVRKMAKTKENNGSFRPATGINAKTNFTPSKNSKPKSFYHRKVRSSSRKKKFIKVNTGLKRRGLKSSLKSLTPKKKGKKMTYSRVSKKRAKSISLNIMNNVNDIGSNNRILDVSKGKKKKKSPDIPVFTMPNRKTNQEIPVFTAMGEKTKDQFAQLLRKNRNLMFEDLNKSLEKEYVPKIYESPLKKKVKKNTIVEEEEDGDEDNTEIIHEKEDEDEDNTEILNEKDDGSEYYENRFIGENDLNSSQEKTPRGFFQKPNTKFDESTSSRFEKLPNEDDVEYSSSDEEDEHLKGSLVEIVGNEEEESFEIHTNEGPNIRSSLKENTNIVYETKVLRDDDDDEMVQMSEGEEEDEENDIEEIEKDDDDDETDLSLVSENNNKDESEEETDLIINIDNKDESEEEKYTGVEKRDDSFLSEGIPEETESEVELIYDPLIKCYYNPETNKYYTLK